MPIVSGAGAVAGGKPCQAVGKTCRALPLPVREMRVNAALRLRAPDWSPRQPLRTDGRRSTMKIEGSNPLRGTAVKRGKAGKGAGRTDFVAVLPHGLHVAVTDAQESTRLFFVDQLMPKAGAVRASGNLRRASERRGARGPLCPGGAVFE